MKNGIVAGASLAVALLVGCVMAAELKSGPQPGSSNIPPFNPLHCNGPTEGQKLCLV
jgi:hypothetical protein